MDQRIGIEWVGTDGSRWNLRSGLVRLATTGLEGFAEPDLTWQTQRRAGVHGRRTIGYLFDHREPWLPLKFDRTVQGDVEGMQREWWQACRPGGVGRLEVTDALGKLRMLDVRVTDNGKVKYPLDPHVWHPPFGLTLSADDPMWYGPEVRREFSLVGGGGESFYGGGVPGASYTYEAKPGGGTYSREVNPATADVRFNYLGRGARMRRSGDFAAAGFGVGTGVTLGTVDEAGSGQALAWSGTLAAAARIASALITSTEGGSAFGAAMRVQNLGTAPMTVRLVINASTSVTTSGTQGEAVTIPAGETRRVTVYGPSMTATARLHLAVTASTPASSVRISDAVVELGRAAGASFDGDSGGAPLFYLLPASASDATTIANDGDEPAWGIYEFMGPLESFTVDINGRVTSGSLIVAKGSTLVVDTQAQTAMLDGVNVLRQLTSLDFAPIPVDGAADIGLRITGSGIARVRVRPTYLRAW